MSEPLTLEDFEAMLEGATSAIRPQRSRCARAHDMTSEEVFRLALRGALAALRRREHLPLDIRPMTPMDREPDKDGAALRDVGAVLLNQKFETSPPLDAMGGKMSDRRVEPSTDPPLEVLAVEFKGDHYQIWQKEVRWYCRSLNHPTIIGEGRTKAEALGYMIQGVEERNER